MTTCYAVVFDMDGLMLDTEPMYREAGQRAARELGFELDDALYLSTVGRNHVDTDQMLVAALGEGFSTEAYGRLWPDYWARAVRVGGIAKKPGLDGLLAMLGTAGIACAVATSSSADHAQLSLSSSGLSDRFLAVVTGDTVPCGKPAPDIYLRAANQINVDPRHCVALEDSDAGALAASRAGMTVLVVPDLKQPSDEIRSLAYRVVHDLHEAREVIETLLAQTPCREG